MPNTIIYLLTKLHTSALWHTHTHTRMCTHTHTHTHTEYTSGSSGSQPGRGWDVSWAPCLHDP